MELVSAPPGAICTLCEKPIPEGEPCYAKTLFLGIMPGNPSLEEVMQQAKPVTNYVCNICLNDHRMA